MGRPALSLEEKTRRGTLEKSREQPDGTRMKPPKEKVGETECVEVVDFTSAAAIISNGDLYYKFDNDSNRTHLNTDLPHFKNIENSFL